MLQIINQIFEIEKKSKEQNTTTFERNIERLYHEFAQMGYTIINPIGSVYDPRDTSVEYNLIGNPENAVVTKVLKPIIYLEDENQKKIVQKGIVIAE